MFEPDLEARNVLLDLFDEGQQVCKLSQTLIWRDPWLVHRSRTGRNQNGIERIVLGPAQMHPAKRLDLNWLQYQHG